MTEEEFLKHYDKSLYERPSVTVDLALFTIIEGTLSVLTVKRTEHPCKGEMALPGVFVRMDETLDEAAGRALEQKTGLRDIYFEQLYTWGDPSRDPRMRVISVSYCALVPYSSIPGGADLDFCSVQAIIEGETSLAFDHSRIVAYGRERIRSKVSWSDIAFALVGDTFTLPQLQRVYEILLGQSLYKANFRKKIAEKIEPTDEMVTGGAHRPSRLYRKRQEKAFDKTDQMC